MKEPDLRCLMAEHTRNPFQALRMMRQSLERDSVGFLQTALHVLREPEAVSGVQCLLTLLVSNDMILELVADSANLPLDRAKWLVRQTAKLDPLLESKIARAAIAPPRLRTPVPEADITLRLLDVIAGCCDIIKLLPILARLVHHQNSKVRSKAALVLGKGNRNANWVSLRLKDADARLRANAVEALWGITTPEVVAVFTDAVSDRDNRVAGNALLGLYYAGDTGSIRMLIAKAKSGSQRSRASSAWVMGESGDRRFLDILHNMQDDSESLVARNVARSIRKLEALPMLPGTLRVWASVARRTDGSAKLFLSLFDEKGAPVSRVLANKVIVREQGRLIEEYELMPQPAGEAIALGWVLPHKQKLSADEAALVSVCQKAWERTRRRSDVWLDQTDALSARVEKVVSSEKGEISQAGSVLRLGLRLEQEEAELRTTFPDKGKTALTLVRLLSAKRLERHLVLLEGFCAAQPALSMEALLALREEAKLSGVAVHVLAKPGVPNAPDLQAVADGTGGYYVELQEAEQATESCTQLYQALSHRMELIYQAEPAPAGQTITAAMTVSLPEGTGVWSRSVAVEASETQQTAEQDWQPAGHVLQAAAQ